MASYTIELRVFMELLMNRTVNYEEQKIPICSTSSSKVYNLVCFNNCWYSFAFFLIFNDTISIETITLVTG
jgi:hypothetical protein